ncbi:MAG: phage tail protein [Caenibius sp.]
MKKPDSLRAKFVTAFPELATDPNRLRMWIEEGAPQCWSPDTDLSFTLNYKLTVVIEQWSRPVTLIFVALIDWLRVHQPELVTPSTDRNAIRFEADVLDNETSDLSFDIELDERVRVTRQPNGQIDIQPLDEPDPMMPDTAPILPSVPLLGQVSVDGQVIWPDDQP